MQRTDQFQAEDLIDLGAASIETKGIPEGPQDDGDLQRFREVGISAD